jgi:hypothetical protein
VGFGPILPNIAGSIHVGWAYLANFPRPRSGKPLKANHIGNHGGQIAESRIDRRFFNRLDRLGFTGVGSALLQSGDRRQGLIDGDRQEFHRRAPLEHPLDFLHLVVDVAAGLILSDEVVLDRPKGLGAELIGLGHAVKIADGSHNPANNVNSSGRDSVFPVVPLAMADKSRAEFDHGYGLLGRGRQTGKRIDGQLGNDAAVLLAGLGRIELSKIAELPADPHESLPAGLV